MSRRLGSVALVALLVASSLVGAVGTTTASYGDTLVVVETSVSPETPTPDENFTVHAKVRNVGDDGKRYVVNEVTVRNTSEHNSTLYARVRNHTAVAPNHTAWENLSVGLDETGPHRLYLHMRLTGWGGDTRHVTRAIDVDVGRPHPSLALTSGPVGPDGKTTLNLTVANGLDREVRGVELGVDPESASVSDSRRVVSNLTPGDQRSFSFEVTGAKPGRETVTTQLSYVTANGTHRSTDRRLSTVLREGAVGPEVTLTSEPVGLDGKTTFDVTVANGMDRTMRGVELSLTPESASVVDGRRVVSSLAPGEQTSFSFAAETSGSGEERVDATVSYTANDVRRSVDRTLSTTVREATNPANVTLTGLRVEETDDTVVVRGSASNLGATNASGVMVTAKSGDGVVPAQSQSQYFVGTVAGSDYSSFEVRARLTTNQTVDIPLEVSYRVDGVQRTKTVTVEYTPTPETPTKQHSSGSQPLVFGGAGLAVVGLGVVGWRRYR